LRHGPLSETAEHRAAGVPGYDARVSELQPGDRFAGHRIDAVAGRGGMGVVYRALQLDLDRHVALKVIAQQLAQDQTFRDRFVRESRAAASIDHPNVIPIYYAGEHDGVLYIAMRYVEGPDLRSLVRAHERLDPERAARLVAQVGAALDAAHARGIVHRDVKPENVLLGASDHVYLTDFGLTKRVDSLAGIPTRPGGWVGTLGYVAPEQIRGERVDARADVYALGCLLVFALTGHAPFRRETEEATLWAHLSEPPPPVSADVPGVPPAFDAVVARAMAKDPAERFQSAGDLGKAALAAAGVIVSDPGERSVATGAAAWEERSTAAEGEGATIPVAPPPGSPRQVSPTPARPTPVSPGAPQAERPGRRSALLVGGAILAALAVGAALAVALSSGGGGGSASSTPPAPGLASVAVGDRPNGIALGGGLAWVLHQPSATVATIDQRSASLTAAAPNVGARPSAITTGFGRVWVANPGLGQLIALGITSQRREGAPIKLPPGNPVAMAADARSIWVGMRSFSGATLVKVDPATGTFTTLPLPYGVQSLTTGAGAVWIRERQKRQVLRLDVADGTRRGFVVGNGPSGIAFGAGRVWVANRADGSVTRIDAGSFNTAVIPVGAQPAGIAVGAGGIWVANQLASTVTRIDPTTERPDAAPITLPASATNPYAIAADGAFAWVTSLANGVVTRIRAPAAR